MAALKGVNRPKITKRAGGPKPVPVATPKSARKVPKPADPTGLAALEFARKVSADPITQEPT